MKTRIHPLRLLKTVGASAIGGAALGALVMGTSIFLPPTAASHISAPVKNETVVVKRQEAWVNFASKGDRGIEQQLEDRSLSIQEVDEALSDPTMLRFSI